MRFQNGLCHLSRRGTFQSKANIFVVVGRWLWSDASGDEGSPSLRGVRQIAFVFLRQVSY